MYDVDNIFARIIRGEVECDKVAESAHAMAFRDLHPVAQTHILVIPKGPYRNILDFAANAPAGEQADFWRLVAQVAAGQGVADNFKTATHTGAKAGQTVFHFHLHIIAD
ncbi:MAG: HIT domain-containing protein [Rickettsiales bacterium]|nr:HIT domain-containing protein [Rickettsiales bacterium]